MTELVGLLASIATLSKCINVVGNCVTAYKGYSDRLESLEKILIAVKTNCESIRWYNEQRKGKARAPVQPNVPHQFDRYIEDLLEESLKNLGSLVKRLEKEIVRLERAQTQKRGFLGLVLNYFHKTTSFVQLVLMEDQLEELISATKNVETSLGVTLTVLLCYQYNAQSTQYEIFVEELRKKFDHPIQAFKESLQRLESNQSPIVMWKQAEPTKQKRHKSKPKQEGSRGLRPKNQVEGVSKELPVLSTFSEENGISSEDPTISLQDAASEHDRFKDAIDSSALLTTSDDGESLQSSQNIEELFTTLNSNLDLNVSEITFCSESLDPTSDIESHTPLTSNNESEIPDSNFTDQLDESFVFDSDKINVQSKSQIFIDIDADPSICFLPDLGVSKFCTRTLFLLDNGEATFLLKNPCKTSCQHVSIQIKLEVFPRKQDLPQIVDIYLDDKPIDTASSTTRRHQLSLSFIVISSSYSKELCTMAYKQGVPKWVVGQYELFSIPRTPHLRIEDDDESRLLNDEEQSSEQDEQQEEEQEETEENNEFSNLPDQNRALGPFSSVPCLFCGRDGLNPRWSEDELSWFLVGSTWISAMIGGFSISDGA